MNISTTARHYDLPPALRDYAESRVAGLKKYFDQIVTAHIIFTVEKYRHRAEITLHVNGRDFVSAEESDDMYASFDSALEKLERQLRRHKEKLRDNRHQTTGLSEASIEASAEEAELAEEGEAETA